jgi:hypothetical protein
MQRMLCTFVSEATCAVLHGTLEQRAGLYYVASSPDEVYFSPGFIIDDTAFAALTDGRTVELTDENSAAVWSVTLVMQSTTPDWAAFDELDYADEDLMAANDAPSTAPSFEALEAALFPKRRVLVATQARLERQYRMTVYRHTGATVVLTHYAYGAAHARQRARDRYKDNLQEVGPATATGMYRYVTQYVETRYT